MISLWIALARRILKLPHGNPEVPAGDPKSVQTWNPGAGYLRYQLLGFWLVAAILLAVAGACFGAAAIVPGKIALDPKVPHWVGQAVAVALCGFGALVIAMCAFNYATIHLELDMLRYTLTDRALRLRRGVTQVEEVTLSFANIQNVKFIQGPLQRAFGIADLIVETAGGGSGLAQPGQPGAEHHRGLIKGVGDPEALRDLMLKRVRAVRGAGLGDKGDPKAKAKKAAAPGILDSPEGRALLAEIRDGLVAVNRARA